MEESSLMLSECEDAFGDATADFCSSLDRLFPMDVLISLLSHAKFFCFATG